MFEGEYKNGKKWTGELYDYKNNIYEINNGKGYYKEFNKDTKLFFEGEHLNGERNGKGKEYFGRQERLIFEGEYLNGIKWNGKGNSPFIDINYEIIDGKKYIQEDDANCLLKNKGEYLDGEIKKGDKFNNNGKTKEYYTYFILESFREYLYDYKRKKQIYCLDNNIEFEGEYLYDHRRKGKTYYSNGNIEFEGEYLYDHRRKGKAYYSNGNIEFEGEYLFDKKWNGKGFDND